jgi:hypothetical protein
LWLFLDPGATAATLDLNYRVFAQIILTAISAQTASWHNNINHLPGGFELIPGPWTSFMDRGCCTNDRGDLFSPKYCGWQYLSGYGSLNYSLRQQF